jgi:hypothetical protein
VALITDLRARCIRGGQKAGGIALTTQEALSGLFWYGKDWERWQNYFLSIGTSVYWSQQIELSRRSGRPEAAAQITAAIAAHQ